MTADEGKELVRRVHEQLFGERGVDALDDFFAEDFMSHSMPPGFPPGLEGAKQFFGAFRDAFSDLRVTIDQLVAEPGAVAVATTMTGTHDGPLLGISPTGRSISVCAMDLLRIEADRIVEHRGLTDTIGLMRQLGVP